MQVPLVFFEYIAWHYSEGIAEFLSAWKNIHWFLYRFFAIPILMRTFFQPFKRIQESYVRGFDPAKFFETAVINLVTRLVGAVVRSIILGIALLSQLFALVFGALLLTLFLAAPLLVPLSVVGGLFLLLFG